MTAFDGEPMIAPLRGLRILVIEDEMMVAMLMEDLLEGFGCTIVGPAGSIDEALRLITTEAIDGAILDLNLAGAESYPVADELARRDILFIFVSGYGNHQLKGEYDNRPRLPKPFRSLDLQRILTATFVPSFEPKG
jgi:CheY-like chemotaxis protein